MYHFTSSTGFRAFDWRHGAGCRTALVLLLVCASTALADPWPYWRGPQLNGVCYEDRLPLVWNEFTGILWRTKLPGAGTSTPIVWEDDVFLTAQAGNDLLLLKVSADQGEIIWRQRVGSGNVGFQPRNCESAPPAERQQFHALQNMASPTPLTNGKLVVVHFGNGDLAAYDFNGEQVWRRNLQDDHGPYTVRFGHANSPVLFGDLVISSCLQRSSNEQAASSYLVAHDINTGELRWHQRLELPGAGAAADAYTTPALLRRGQEWQMVVAGGNRLAAYDPRSGRRQWFFDDFLGDRAISGPTIAHDLVFVTRGSGGPMIAVPTDRAGEVDRSDVVWKYDRGTPEVTSPVAWGDLLFFVTDTGVAKCIDLHTGDFRWQERLGGRFYASPVAAEGRVYFQSGDGICHVVSAAPRFQRLAKNELDDTFLASPAFSNRRIFLRGQGALYCIGKK